MKFYRYEARVYAELDRDGEFVSPQIPNPKIELMEFNLHKETPKGYWIGYGHPDNGLQSYDRWVSKTSLKRYAYPTKEEALNNYILRTEKRIKILKSHLEICEYALIKAKNALMNAKKITLDLEIKNV